MTLRLFQHETAVDQFAPGDVIFREGQPGTLMYVVQSGEVDVIHDDRLLETVGPNGIIGEMALVNQEPRSATVVAKTACRLVPIDRDRFSLLVQQRPYFALYVMQVLAGRLRGLHSVL